MTIEIFLSALPSDDLLWEEQRKLAELAALHGNKILWNIDLGIDPVVESLTDEAAFQQRALALTTFSKQLFPAFAEISAGIVIASSGLYRKLDPRDEWESEFALLEEPFATQLKAITVFADYLHRIASCLPDDLPVSVYIDATAAKRASDIAVLLSKERFRHICLIVTGWFPKEGGVGCVIPEDTHCSEATMMALDDVFTWLDEEGVAFRLVSEALLNEEWNGLDCLVMLADAVSPVGKRKALGFVAAGGQIMSYGGTLGIDGEIAIDKRNRSRGIRTPDLLLPKQPR